MQGYAAHKLAILVKLAVYIADTDKAFAKNQPPKMMYVVPNEFSQTNISSPIGKYSDQFDRDEQNEEEYEAAGSYLDDLDQTTSGYGELPPAPLSAQSQYSQSSYQQSSPSQQQHQQQNPQQYVHHAEPPKAWPQTDFIKKHILDNSKLKNLNNSPGRITSASKSRSTTPTSVRKSRLESTTNPSAAYASNTNSHSNTAHGGLDMYDIEEKTAALEAIQALRAARNGTSVSPAKVSNYSTFAPSAESPVSKPPLSVTYAVDSSQDANNTLSELAAASLDGNSNQTNTNHRSHNNNYINNNNNLVNANMGNPTSVGVSAADVQTAVAQAVDRAVLEKLTADPEVQKVSTQKSCIPVCTYLCGFTKV